ncbi:hypothetical protein F53441_7412 [Fusarium austroafricanum]|uniref:C2H2-type domain-containing protein n=1 Tax=Fusarium austroafricanum TaxID=2364996 RepID=A0A8H4NS88_9HYPO|nr:hypothetical protein F53441_7412 [Fusarium austroafricanum]
MDRKPLPMNSLQGPMNAMPIMAAEPSDPSRQRPSRSTSSLIKRARGKFRSLLDIKTRIGDRRDPQVLRDLVKGHLGTDDLEIQPTKGAIQMPIEAPPPNENELREAVFPKTLEEQRRGMFAFQDPSVMLGEDISASSPTADLGWLPVDEQKSNSGTARNMSRMLLTMRKFSMRLRDSKAAHEHPGQEPYRPPRSRSATIPRDSPTRGLNDTLRAMNQNSRRIEKSRRGTSATQDNNARGASSELTEFASSTGFDCESRRDDSPTHTMMQSRSRKDWSETIASGHGSSATSIEEETSSASATDDNDGASDVTDYTDISLIERFESFLVPSNIALLSALMSIKDEVISRMVRRAQLATPSAQGVRQHVSGKAQSTQFVSEDSGTSSSNNSSHRHLPNARKRLLDNDDQGYDAGDGGDEKERRTREDLTSALLPSQRTQKFACPFYKKYPESSSLPKSCHGPGWQSVHRVKEHIYRRHQRPIHRCARCLVFFEDERELIEHTRAEQRCDNQSAPAEEEIIYITQAQERALRKRHRNIPEEERWILVFQVVFPDVPADHIPSPYYKIDPGDLATDAATLDEFRAFVVQELPSRIINDVNNHLRFLPGVTIVGDQMASILRETIQEVVGEFMHVPESQGRHQVTSPVMGVGSETDLGEISALTTRNISVIPLHPLDISSMCQPSWLPGMTSPSPWSDNLYADPSAVLSQDLGLQPSFMMTDSVPRTQVLGSEPSSGGHYFRHKGTQDEGHVDELFGFPDFLEHF